MTRSCGAATFLSMGLDLLMVTLVVAFFAFTAALVVWLDRI
jgi:hypothetical protein